VLTLSSKTYSIPETLHDPSLLLNAQIVLLTLLFRHGVFRTRNLTSPCQLSKINIYPGENELPIPLRKDLADLYVFRRVVKTFDRLRQIRKRPHNIPNDAVIGHHNRPNPGRKVYNSHLQPALQCRQ